MKKLLEPYNLSIKSSKKIMEIFKEKKYTKKDKVSFYGEISTKFYILKSGIIRSFYKDEKGKENIRFLHNGPVVVGSFCSLILNKPSTITYDCLTDCTLLECDFKVFKRLAKNNVELSNLYNSILEENYLDMENRIHDLTSLDAKSLYLKLKTESPEIEKSIPLYHIASYLNVTPVQLSRIRRELYKS
jgi:CRP-like cAMP-binding protein